MQNLKKPFVKKAASKYYIASLTFLFCVWGIQLKAGNHANSSNSRPYTEEKIDSFSFISHLNAWYSTEEDRIYVNLIFDSHARVNIKVADIKGKIVMETDAHAGNGLTQLSLFMMGFSRGAYTVIATENQGNTKKISLLKF